MTPRATYRIQFHAGFTFADGAALAPYLADLGISHLYASPIATARAGSIHGYDVIDPTTINPALGGEDGFRSMVEVLRAHGLGVILDIVPNHVAVGGDDNGWWMDVLEKGPASPYARFFDIDWSPGAPALEQRMLAPFLGAPYGEVLSSGDLKLGLEADGTPSVRAYGVHRFPIRPEDQATILAESERLDALYDGREPEGRARLHDLLERQHYRLAWWRTAGDQINWRRFFDISELAGLRIEDEAVFDAVHALPLRLFAEGLIDGLRVDHVDGLADPAGYCRRLRHRLEQAGRPRPAGLQAPAYLVIEKILAADEPLAADWGVDGTTGYDFMNAVSAVLHDPRGAESLGRTWARLSGRSADFEDEERPARAEILSRSFAAQHAAAALAFERLARTDLATRDLTQAGFARAIAAVVTAFTRYRTYGDGMQAPASDAAVRDAVRADALALLGPTDHPALDFILDALAGRAGEGGRDAVRRLQQLTAPVTAKAVEDTAFYRYGRLLSRNDVGFDPDRLGAEPEAFHAWIQAQADFPRRMLASATHDHKRGEDVRARLAVLSEIPEIWTAEADQWLDLAPLGEVEPGDAYQLFQTLVGAWPDSFDPTDPAQREAFAERVAGWMQKAVREAKLRSSWTAPDADYEAACRTLIEAVLTDPALSRRIGAFVDRLAPAAQAKSLVQTGLKLTLPGVPDIYQGAELWDFSLVDPDNRRPVDYDLRRRLLAEDAAAGAAKQRLIRDLLHLRRDRPDLFDGDFQPVALEGARAAAGLAFRRRGGGRSLIVCAAVRGAPDGDAWWDDTRLDLPGRPAAADLTGGAAFGWTVLDEA